jgi:hypothetical protein
MMGTAKLHRPSTSRPIFSGPAGPVQLPVPSASKRTRRGADAVRKTGSTVSAAATPTDIVSMAAAAAIHTARHMTSPQPPPRFAALQPV